MAFVLQVLHPDIELIGVTSVFGNATIDTTTRNACYLAGRFAPGVPVARGAASPLDGAPPAPLAAIHGDVLRLRRSMRARRRASSSTAFVSVHPR
jgi:purine nucleosidase